MLLPKRVKYRRVHRGRMTGKATRGNTIAYGEFGLQALEPAWIDQKSHGRFSDILPHRNGAVRPVLRVIRSGKLSPPGSLPVFSCGFYRYSMWVHIPLWPDCPTWPSPPGPRGQTAQETALESIARSGG